VDEITRRLFGRTLRQLRTDARLSQRRLACRVPVSQATLSRYESGAQAPDAAMAGRLDELLGADGELRALAEQIPAYPEDQGEEDMRRRTLLAGAGGAVLGGALGALDPVRRDTDAALGGPVSKHDAIEWERTADEYARLVNQLPAQRVLPDLLVDLDDARRHLDLAPVSLKPRLARVCALFSGLAALSLVGVGHWHDATRYWRLAERAARHSGDHAVSCVIGGRRAVFSLYAPGSTPETALALAADALAWGEGKPSAGTASALATRAQVFAMVGNRAGARGTLNDLEAVFGRLDDDTTRYGPMPSEWTWPEARLRHVRSFVHSHLGDRQATAAQDAALALYSYPAVSLGAAQVRCHQAMSMIVTGDPTGGARHIVTVLDSLDPSFLGGFVKTSAVRALRVLPERAAGLPEVRQARELLGASA
jgi:transcriptional regulator with XRE-family HTH domain